MYDISPAPSRVPRKTVLLVVEEPTVRELISVNLRYAGFFPIVAATAQEGCRLAGEVMPDLIFIDLDSPSTGDVSFLSTIESRRGRRKVPTVMATSHLKTSCGLRGKVCGATLCLEKPLSTRELVACIAKQMRKPGAEPKARNASAPPADAMLKVGPLELNVKERTARVLDGERSEILDLTAVELKLLACFVSEPDRLHAREDLVDRVWGNSQPVELRTVDQYVKRVRRLLEAAGAPQLIQTVRGAGYRLNVPSARVKRPG